MNRQAQETVVPTGGINKDINPGLLPAHQSPSAENTAVVADGIEQRPGFVNYGANLALDSQIVGLHRFLKLDDTNYQFAFTLDHAYIFDATATLFTPNCWQNLTKGNVIEDCDDAWTANANVTATADTTVEKRGSAASKLVIAAGFTTGIAAYENFAAVDIFTAGDTYLHFWVRSSLVLAAGDYRLRLSGAANGASSGVYADYNVPAMATADTWTKVIVLLSAPDNDDGGTYPNDLTAIESVALIVVSDEGADDAVYIDDVRTLKVFTGTGANWVDSAVFPMVGGEKVFFCNNIDQVMQWAGPESTAGQETLNELTNSPINYCKALGVYLNYLLLLGTDESAQRMRWCDTGDASNWTTGRSGFQDLVDDNSAILGGTQVGSVFAIFKEESIVNMRFISGSSFIATASFAIFSFETIMSGLGCLAGDTVRNVPGAVCIFLASDYGLYTYNGNVVTPISNNLIKAWIKDNISTEHKQRSFAIVNTDKDEYYLFIPTEGASMPDKMLVYNYVNGVWWEGGIAATAAGLFYPSSTATWGAQTAVWSAAIGRWMDASGETGRRVHLIGDSSGNIKNYGADVNDSAVAITSDYQTKDYRFNTANRRERVVEFRFEAKGDSVDVMHSINSGATWMGQTSITLTQNLAEYKYYLNVSPKKIRFRFYNNTASEAWHVGWYYVTTVPRKR